MNTLTFLHTTQATLRPFSLTTIEKLPNRVMCNRETEFFVPFSSATNVPLCRERMFKNHVSLILYCWACRVEKRIAKTFLAKEMEKIVVKNRDDKAV